MFSKKFILPFLLFFSLSLNNCEINKKEAINNEKNIKPVTSENFVEKDRTYSKIIEAEKANKEKYLLKINRDEKYFLDNIKNKPYLENEEYLREEINRFIHISKHTYTKKDTNNTIFYDTSELNLSQLQRIYLMYKSLENHYFTQKIGKIIEEDIRDPFAEHGGIIIFDKKEISFRTLESYLEKDTSNNKFYGTPDEAITNPSLAYFHLHATSYDESKFAHPSNGDLIISYYHTHLFNETHDFLITPLKKGKFNIDYYGGHKTENPITKILDLGNYIYDTIDIK